MIYFSLAESPLCIFHGIFFVNLILSLWLPFGQLWAPFGSLWISLGFLWVFFVSRWLPLACPWAFFGSLWGALGPHWQPHWKLDVLYRRMYQIHETVNKTQLWGIYPRSPWSPRKWCQQVLLRPFHTRRGVRMTGVKQTPSKKIL